MSILNRLKNLPKWEPSISLYFRKYTCKIMLGPFTDWEDTVHVDKPHRCKIQYVFNKESDSYDVYNSVYTDDLDLVSSLEANYDYKSIRTPANNEHAKLLQSSKDNKIIIRERLWYNKYRYRVEVYRNWREQGFKEENLKAAHDFINESFNFDITKKRSVMHYNSYSVPNLYTNDLNSIMLLKLAYNDSLRIHVQEVKLIDELK